MLTIATIGVSWFVVVMIYLMAIGGNRGRA